MSFGLRYRPNQFKLCVDVTVMDLFMDLAYWEWLFDLLQFGDVREELWGDVGAVCWLWW